MIQIAVLASGAGSNAKKIIEHFAQHPKARVGLIICNKPQAGVVQIAQLFQIPLLLIERERFFRGDGYLPEIRAHHIDFVVLAGFLWKIPQTLIQHFPKRIINIHPALLPKHGGKGMYGSFVHQAVVMAKDAESGITIHYVDEHYDNGDIIFQARCPVFSTDDADSLSMRIHQLEHQHYPEVIEQLINNLPS